MGRPNGLQAINELSGEMLASGATEHPEDGARTIGIEIATDPDQVERELRGGPLGKVMLGDGRSLLAPYAESSEKARDLVIGDIRPSAIEIVASTRSWRSTLPFTVSSALTDHSRHHVGIGIWYGERTDKQKGDAVQYVGAGYSFDAFSGYADRTMSRVVAATRRSRGDKYYHGHNQRQREVSDKKLLVVARTVRELFELQPVEQVQ